MTKKLKRSAIAAGAAVVTAAAVLSAPQAFADERLKALDRLVAEDGFPGALASVRGTAGAVRDYTAGVRDLRTRRAVPTNGQVRIGSNTKTFTAVVVLQLAGEGKVDLDQTVEHYLPGIVRGNGNDGSRITVRQLLQQTSGLPDYDDVLFTKPEDLAGLAHTYFDPRRLVDAAMTKAPSFPPGARWEYSNTNYVLAGLIAERVTSRPIGEEITRRVIDPLRLRDTYWPGVGEQRLRGTHAQGYVAVGPGAPWIDVTQMDPSLGWSAGQLVSTPSDLRVFFEALIGGRLLRPAQQQAMLTTVPAPGFEPTPGWEYGLGVARHALSCGGYGWGHGGDIQGYETRNLVTTDGRSAVVAVTGLPTSERMVTDVVDAVDAALCA
ncbi:beta-lactamase family protein [Dactylosporangium vinaceum]|uniref:Serine hydrolase domain-containing protein n=1 Tax=Dactylosporangium vinaceum TaxID=53362 RepID=A0ABV5MDP4_9ACTN|nr:serine hydrolase domain-containing protein [Dactylosporangium vinaceum]UAC01105.1 beta-lactamase family protein [Dactylosporangium vinaceum]